MAIWAAVFPGQGSQSAGMGRGLAEVSPAAREVFERANQVVGYDLARVCIDGAADELERTDVQQPAIFVSSVAFWAAFMEGGGRREQFSRLGGLSLGEYTALHAGGAIDFEDALTLVQRRGQLMQRAALAAPGAMVSLIGATEAVATELCDKVRGDEILAPANFNCPGQVVISGSRGACGRAVAAAESFGCKALALPVAGAFHSELMSSAAVELAKTLERTRVARPAIQVIANFDCAYHQEPNAIRDSLTRQLTNPVRWQECMERIIEDGVDRVVEFGPGRVLTGLMRKINRTVEAVNISSAEALPGVAAQLAG